MSEIKNINGMTIKDETARNSINELREEMEETRAELEEVKSSVSNGKSLVASAITDKGINTSGNATFATMARNIRLIETGTSDGGDGETVIVYAQSVSLNYSNIDLKKGIFYFFGTYNI